MNASTAHILYLIDSDGNIGVPNTSENSLPNVQGAFQTGERFRISSRTIGSGPAEQFRTVIRGGQRIEPILYTQSGSQPGAQWVDLNLIDVVLGEDNATSNYTNRGSIKASYPYDNSASSYDIRRRFEFSPNPLNSPYIGTAVGSGGINYNYFQVPTGMVEENVDLIIQCDRFIFNKKFVFYTQSPYPEYKIGIIIKSTNPTNDNIVVKTKEYQHVWYSNEEFPEWTYTIPSSNLVAGEQISIEWVVDELANFDNQEYLGNGEFAIRIQAGAGYSFLQNPFPTPTITPGENNIWGFYDRTNYPYIITSSDAVSESLMQFYNNPKVKQKDIQGSGFEPIALPWSIKYGDEFRFEGDERFTYMVKDIYGPNETSGSRVSETGSIEVHFNKNLPVNASASFFNLDHFLIRRYVDDASQIIFEGFKPLQSQGPFILTPEFSTSELNTNIDDVITNLKERGLITGEEGT